MLAGRAVSVSSSIGILQPTVYNVRSNAYVYTRRNATAMTEPRSRRSPSTSPTARARVLAASTSGSRAARSSLCSAPTAPARRRRCGSSATLIRPDAGRPASPGFDVVADRHRVRRAISLTGQYAAVDELQTGEENLRMMGRLAGLGRAAARARAGELLARFDLTDAARRRVGDLLGWHAPAARPRGEPRRAPVGALPRRADDRPGPAQPPGDVGRRSPASSARA